MQINFVSYSHNSKKNAYVRLQEKQRVGQRIRLATFTEIPCTCMNIIPEYYNKITVSSFPPAYKVSDHAVHHQSVAQTWVMLTVFR